VTQVVSILDSFSNAESLAVLQNAIDKIATSVSTVLPQIDESELPAAEPTLSAEIPPWPKQSDFDEVSEAAKAIVAQAVAMSVCLTIIVYMMNRR